MGTNISLHGVSSEFTTPRLSQTRLVQLEQWITSGYYFMNFYENSKFQSVEIRVRNSRYVELGLKTLGKYIGCYCS